jgi:hypothetical protein
MPRSKRPKFERVVDINNGSTWMVWDKGPWGVDVVDGTHFAAQVFSEEGYTSEEGDEDTETEVFPRTLGGLKEAEDFLSNNGGPDDIHLVDVEKGVGRPEDLRYYREDRLKDERLWSERIEKDRKHADVRRE